MTVEEKYSKILKLRSVGNLTAGTYPTLREFQDALENNRVFGDYEKRVVIMSNDPHDHSIQYIFEIE